MQCFNRKLAVLEVFLIDHQVYFIDHQVYRNYCVEFNKLLKQARIRYYYEKITACGRDQKSYFQCGQRSKVTTKFLLTIELPSQGLPGVCSDFFCDKIDKVCDHFEIHDGDINTDHLLFNDPPSIIPLHRFKPVSEEELQMLILKSPSKSCSLDPVPTWLLKSC